MSDPLNRLEIDGFGHWLAGFVDGEGTFLIYRRRSAYVCRLAVEVRSDELGILEEIQCRLNLGRIQPLRPRARGNPLVRWCVDSPTGCDALVAFFDRYPLRAKKARDYAVWRQAVAAWATYDWIRMGELKDELAAGRAFVAAA